MNVQRQYHGRRLGTFVDQLIADPDLHHEPPWDAAANAPPYVADDVRGRFLPLERPCAGRVPSTTLTATSMPRKEEAFR